MQLLFCVCVTICVKGATGGNKVSAVFCHSFRSGEAQTANTHLVTVKN